jgi:hypothetical protein
MSQKWTKEAIALEIVNMYESGENLARSHVEMSYPTLLSAATRHLGSWEGAVRFAGLDYDRFRLYQSWTRERIIARIQELHAQGSDLSWGSVSRRTDKGLAAAATRKNHFGSWREALAAAGIDYDTVRRYREWNRLQIVKMVRHRHDCGASLNAMNVDRDDTALITAARRQFDSWPDAITAAGLDYREIVKRAPFKRGLGRGQSKRPIPSGDG